MDQDGKTSVGWPTWFKNNSYFHYIFSVIFLFYCYFLTPEIPTFLFSETHFQLDALICIYTGLPLICIALKSMRNDREIFS